MNLKELIQLCDDLANQSERRKFLHDTGVDDKLIRLILACYP